MIEPLNIIEITNVQRQIPATAGATLDLAKKLNELIEAYNEHTHEVAGNVFTGTVGTQTSKPVPAQPREEVSE